MIPNTGRSANLPTIPKTSVINDNTKKNRLNIFIMLLDSPFLTEIVNLASPNEDIQNSSRCQATLNKARRPRQGPALKGMDDVSDGKPTVGEG